MEPAEKDKIEITEEMIKAGIEADSIWDSRDLPEWRVIDIYRQMERARRGVMANEKTGAGTPVAEASD